MSEKEGESPQIQAKELRIGNLTYKILKGKRHVDEIDYLDLAGLSGCRHYILPMGLLLKPIPLTEEWLIKFGFEKLKNNGIDYELHDCVISFEAKWMWTSESKLNEVRTLIPKYVHQLQNLYFALTGEELTIKE